MIPTTGDATESAQTVVDGRRAGTTDVDIVRDISPRGLEILESLNTVFDALVNEEK